MSVFAANFDVNKSLSTEYSVSFVVIRAIGMEKLKGAVWMF